MKKFIILVCYLFLALFFSAIGVNAAEAPAKPWKANAEISFVNANGNTKATTLSAKGKYNYDWTKSGLEVEAGAFSTANQAITTAEQYFASEKITWKLNVRNYLFEKIRWDKDRFAGVKNRYDAGVGYGRIILDLPNDKLNAELGAGYISEEHYNDIPNNDYASGRAYAKYLHILSATASASQDVEYLANLKDNNGYRVTAETALIAALSTHLSLKTSFIVKHVNEPPAGFYKNDTLLLVTLIINY